MTTYNFFGASYGLLDNDRRPRTRLRLVRTCTIALVLVLSACSSGQESASVTEPVQDSSAPIGTTASTETPVANETIVSAQQAETSVSVGRTDTTDGAATNETTPARTAPVEVGSDTITSIVVESTPEQYFVLYVRPELASPVEIPVAIARGEGGKTTLTDGRSTLPVDHYRVDTLSVSAPGDADGDGIDDLTELDSPTTANPLNPAPAMDIATGAVIIPDKATFEKLSYQGDEVARDAYLAGLEFVKFWLVDTDSAHPSVYFMNTEAYKAHPMFAQAVGIPGGRGPAPGKMRGDIVYDAEAIGPDGTPGRYRFAFQPNDTYLFSEIALAYELLATSMPSIAHKLTYYPFPQSALPVYEAEKAQYDAYRVPVLVE